MKRLFVFALALSIALSPLVTPAAYALGSGIQPRSWAGRPGGNGDGSEEYLYLGYGQMNGPWRYIRKTSGKVYDLNYRQKLVAGSIASIITASITGPIGAFAGVLYNAMPDTFEGTSYTWTIYVSGRRAKHVVHTYASRYPSGHPYRTYVFYNKW